jgi:hypothetical protein
MPAPFPSARAAKDFLVERISAQATRDLEPLSDVERKMLYFSEQYDSLPDMAEVTDEFERTQDDDAYEKKMAALTRRAYKHDAKESREIRQRWLSAIRLLKKEDHYILVITRMAQLRPRFDRPKLAVYAIVFTVVMLALLYAGSTIAGRFHIDIWSDSSSRNWNSNSDRGLIFWLGGLTFCVIFWVVTRTPKATVTTVRWIQKFCRAIGLS